MDLQVNTVDNEYQGFHKTDPYKLWARAMVAQNRLLHLRRKIVRHLQKNSEFLRYFRLKEPKFNPKKQLITQNVGMSD